MSTRRLILLALACGLAILIAGGVQLLRISNNEAATLAVGDSAELATVGATLASAEVADGHVRVVVRLSQDPSASTAFEGGLVGWSLLTGGLKEPVAAVKEDDGTVPSCDALTVDPGSTAECSLAFPVVPTREGTTYVTFSFAGSSATWLLGL